METVSLVLHDASVLEVEGVKISPVVIKDLCKNGSPKGILFCINRVGDGLEARTFRNAEEAAKFFAEP